MKKCLGSLSSNSKSLQAIWYLPIVVVVFPECKSEAFPIHPFCKLLQENGVKYLKTIDPLLTLQRFLWPTEQRTISQMVSISPWVIPFGSS